MQENYTAPRIVLAGYGVEHEELVSVAEPLLSDLTSVPRPEEPESLYTGGDYRCHVDSGVCLFYVPVNNLFFHYFSSKAYICNYLLLDQKTHFALAFELPGGWHKEKEAMTLTVLQVLILNSLVTSCA